jgi:hypothetical protein
MRPAIKIKECAGYHGPETKGCGRIIKHSVELCSKCNALRIRRAIKAIETSVLFPSDLARG